MTEERKAFWAKCWTCQHCWPIVYYPMEVSKFAKIAKRPVCPMCGERKEIGIAKQDHGKLLEAT